MADKVVKFVQMVAYPFMNFYFKKVFDSKVDVKVKLERDKKYIFAPNHQRYIDPFIIFYSLSFKELYPLLPLKFMATPKYMKKFFSGGILRMFGCYDSSEESLKKSIEFLKNNNNLCIFPQGKLSKGGRGKAKVGVIYIQREIKGSIIVPVNINYGGKRAHIIFIKKIKNKKFPNDLQPLADEVLKVIKQKK
ncbi:MAG: lysophospholipid acyltransferase family protein [archaeon]